VKKIQAMDKKLRGMKNMVKHELNDTSKIHRNLVEQRENFLSQQTDPDKVNQANQKGKISLKDAL
jgi:hypothetical protein